MIRFLQIVLLAAMVAPILGTGDPHALLGQDVPGKIQPGGQILINYDDVPLVDFVKSVAPMLAISPLQIDPDVHGSVTIRATAPISQESLRRLFEGVLYNNSAALRKSGDSYRVVTLASINAAGSAQLPAPDPPKREPIRVSGDVQSARLICRVEPVYPELAKRARVTGVASLLEVTINEQGEVSKVLVIRSGHPLVMLAAVAAVKLWLYSPTIRDGVAVPVITTVTVPFKLR
jgi:TonB family protein